MPREKCSPNRAKLIISSPVWWCGAKIFFDKTHSLDLCFPVKSPNVISNFHRKAKKGGWGKWIYEIWELRSLESSTICCSASKCFCFHSKLKTKWNCQSKFKEGSRRENSHEIPYKIENLSGISDVRLKPAQDLKLSDCQALQVYFHSPNLIRSDITVCWILPFCFDIWIWSNGLVDLKQFGVGLFWKNCRRREIWDWVRQPGFYCSKKREVFRIHLKIGHNYCHYDITERQKFQLNSNKKSKNYFLQFNIFRGRISKRAQKRNQPYHCDWSDRILEKLKRFATHREATHLSWQDGKSPNMWHHWKISWSWFWEFPQFYCMQQVSFLCRSSFHSERRLLILRREDLPGSPLEGEAFMQICSIPNTQLGNNRILTTLQVLSSLSIIIKERQKRACHQKVQQVEVLLSVHMCSRSIHVPWKCQTRRFRQSLKREIATVSMNCIVVL